MTTQILPQTLVFQEAATVATAITNPLRAFIFGADYNVQKYTDANKANIKVGQYAGAEVAFSYPNRQSGDVVDLGFTKVKLEQAKAKYFSDAIGSGDTWAGTSTTLRAAATVLKAANNVARDSDIPVDVAVGDKVKVTKGTDTFETSVIGFIAETVVAAIPAHATRDSTNAPSGNVSSSASSVVNTAGNSLLVIDSADFASYDGLASGKITETYTLEITQGGTLGTDTIVAKVVSGSGTDNDDAVTITLDTGTDSDPITIGSRGLTAILTGSTSYPVGWKASFSVVQTYTYVANIVSADGDYSGKKDTTYRINITQGGVVGTDELKFTVSTTNGLDVSGPHTVAASYTPGDDISIGNYGITIAFGAGSVVAGDKYSLAVVADTAGGIQTVVVADALPTVYQSGDVGVDFYKVVSVDVPKTRDTVVANWEGASLEVTLKAGIQVDLGYGDLDVVSGDVFIEWRGISQRNANAVKAISDISELSTYFPGYVGPESGLAYAVSKAVANANGTDVRFAGIAADTTDGWLAILDLIKEKDDIYGLVPLSKSRTILDLVAAHAEAQSGPENGRWRVAWFGSSDDDTAGIVGTDTEVNATIIDNPDQSGTQYTLVVAASGSFVTKGVRSGDKLRTNFTLNSLGETVYDEYEIDTVVNNNRLVLVSGPDASVVVAQKIEIWRTLNSQDKTSKLILENTFATKRVRSIFPGHVEAAEGEVDSYFLAAALAGLRSGVAPQQGLTNVEISGFTGVSQTVNEFSRTQLDALANAGYWIVTQNVNTGVIYTRKQLTTDITSVDTAEDSVVATDDAISYQYAAVLSKYIGRTNVTDSNISLISADLSAVTSFLKNEGFTPSLGGLISDATIESLRRHAIYPDRLVCVMNVTRPAPLNNLELHLVFAF